MTHTMYQELHSGNYHEELAKYAHLKLKLTDEAESARRQAYAEVKKQSRVFDGIVELLADLHQSGKTLVLNTNAYERNCLPLLERVGIQPLFDFVATAEHSKNKTEKFKCIQEKYGVRTEDMLFITDALGDVREAKAVNIPSIAVTWGVHDQSFFQREQHANLVAIVNSVAELKDLLS